MHCVEARSGCTGAGVWVRWCLGEYRKGQILINTEIKLGWEGGVGEGTSSWGDASTMGEGTSDWRDASTSGMGGRTLGWGDACRMGAGISGLVTTRGVVVRWPQPLATLVLGLVVESRPWPPAVLVLGLAVARWPWVGVLTSVALVLGLAVATGSVSCPLFAYPFAARPPPSPATLFRTHRHGCELGCL